jgi:hypothetical protein
MVKLGELLLSADIFKRFSSESVKNSKFTFTIFTWEKKIGERNEIKKRFYRESGKFYIGAYIRQLHNKSFN